MFIVLLAFVSCNNQKKSEYQTKSFPDWEAMANKLIERKCNQKINKNSSGITLGKINNINIGDIALAIGNPLGVGQTITLGIISATDKEISPNAYSYQRYVQTDAAINPGNSGGALVNSNGELIGINTSIISISGGADGIGFAIPIDIVKYVFSEIIENGEVIRGYVGISAEVNYRGLGVLVNGVIPDSPADKSGV